MTSGKFINIDINSIVVDRDNRQRRALTGLDELAESIRSVGLINPPVVDDNLNLIAGERRLTTCRDILGWTAIPVQFASDCDPEELHLIELEENVKRVDLSWQDQCRAVAEYHAMKSRDPEWTGAKTAKALGITQTELSHRVYVQKALEDGNPLVVAADKYSVARGIVERQLSRAKSSAVDSFDAMLAPKKMAEFVMNGSGEEDDVSYSTPEKPYVAPEVDVPFLHADFSEWQPHYTGPKFNFIHCDFPYGVNADNHNQGAAGKFGGYADSADVYWKLLETLRLSMDNVVAESAHLMFWFSMDYYNETKELLSAMGWRVNPFPMLWHKSDNSGILPDPKRGPRRIYETAFIASRGDRFVVQPVSNLFSAPNLKTIHMSEKNSEMLRHFFRMFVDSSTYILDPTMGSGSAIKVAESMGAAHCLGLERDPEFFSAAKTSYIESLLSTA